MGIVTDSSGERPANVYAIHTLLKTEEELAPVYEMHTGKYKALKEALIEDLDAYIAPMRERRSAISDSDVIAILKDGAVRARERAVAKLIDVRKKIGVAL
jgi:tryptophanyl-tRNA synthetase